MVHINANKFLECRVAFIVVCLYIGIIERQTKKLRYFFELHTVRPFKTIFFYIRDTVKLFRRYFSSKQFYSFFVRIIHLRTRYFAIERIQQLMSLFLVSSFYKVHKHPIDNRKQMFLFKGKFPATLQCFCSFIILLSQIQCNA